MKNIIRFIGFIAIVAVIGFSFTACDEDDPPPERIRVVENTSGVLTISGLEAYNNKYVGAWLGYLGMGDGQPQNLWAFSNITPKGQITFSLVSDSTITLKVWKEENGGDKYGNYNGSGNYNIQTIWISNEPTYELGNSLLPEGLIDVYAAHINVNFTSGTGSVTYTPEEN